MMQMRCWREYSNNWLNVLISDAVLAPNVKKIDKEDISFQRLPADEKLKQKRTRFFRRPKSNLSKAEATGGVL